MMEPVRSGRDADLPRAVPADGSSPDGGATRYGLVLVALLSMNYGIVFFDRNALGFLMPFIQPELGLTGTQIGLLSSALALTWALSAFGMGRLSDRLGKRKGLLVVSTLIFSLCSGITGMATNFATLLGARLLMGVSEGGVMPISQTMIASAVPARHRSLAMGVTQNLGSSLLGTFVAPLVLVAIAVHLGWRHAFLFAALPGLVMALLLLLFVRNDASVAGQQQRCAPVPIAALFAHRNVLLCALIAILCVAFFLTSMTFLPLYLVKTRGMAPSAMGWLVAILGIASTVNSVFLSILADRFGRKTMMILGAMLGLLVPIGALTYDGPFVGLAIMFALGWTPIALFPLFMATIPSETVDPAHAATAIGLIMAVGEVIGGVVFPVLAGAASDWFGAQSTMWMLVALSLATALLSLGLDETAPRLQAGSRRASDGTAAKQYDLKTVAR